VQNLLGYTPLQTGLLMMPAALTMGVFMPVSGRLFDKVGAFWPGFVGLTTAAVVTYRLHTLGLLSSYHGIQITLVVWAVGLGLSMMPLSTAGLYTIPAALVSRATTLFTLVRQIAASMGIAFLTYIWTSRQIYHYNWLAGTVTYSSLTGGNNLHSVLAAYGRSGSVSLLSKLALRQSATLGIDDAILAAAVFIMAAVPLLFFLTKGRMDAARSRQLAAFDNDPPR